MLLKYYTLEKNFPKFGSQNVPSIFFKNMPHGIQYTFEVKSFYSFSNGLISLLFQNRQINVSVLNAFNGT